MADSATLAVAECSCGHRAERHDAIADRYCAATDAHNLPRSCICKPVPVTP